MTRRSCADELAFSFAPVKKKSVAASSEILQVEPFHCRMSLARLERIERRVIDQPHEVDLEVPTCLVLVQGGVFRAGALVVDGANWSGLLPLELKR